MSGLLLMFLIKSARKLVCASFRVVESLVLAILMGFAVRTFNGDSGQPVAPRECFGRQRWSGIVDDKKSEDGRWSINLGLAAQVYEL